VALVAGGCVVHPAGPRSQPTHVVVVLEGTKAKELTGELTDMLGDRYQIVPDKDYRKAARTLHARHVNPGNVKKLAAQIGADAVIVGQIGRRGHDRYRLRLQLRSGVSGEWVKSWKLTLHQPSLGKQRDELSGLYARIDDLPRLGAGKPGHGEAVASKDKDKGDQADKAEKKDDKALAKAEKQDDKALAKAEKQDDKAVAKAEKKDDKAAAKAEKKDDKAVAKAEKKEDKAVAKKDDKKQAADDDDDDDFAMDVKTDENGQALDDERPPGM
jgi:hypothetical protein